MAMKQLYLDRQVENDLVPKRFTPVGTLVVCKQFRAPEVTASGLNLPAQSQADWETPMARVVAVGPEAKQVKAGDVVLIGLSTPAVKVRHAGDELIAVTEGSIIGVVDNPPPMPR